jgi:uncharacterized protein (DUF1015 family)
LNLSAAVVVDVIAASWALQTDTFVTKTLVGGAFMALIRPFKMVHYGKEFEAELERLITPPYDVISPDQQDGFYRSHPLNMIRLVLGKQGDQDSDADNRYTRAASTLSLWLDQGVLVREQTPGLMVYQMDFEMPEGGRATIDGIVALVKVDDYSRGKVLPHEKTYSGPKEDQLRLLRACRAHFTPIHALFDDETQEVMDAYRMFTNGSPLQETCDSSGTVHRVWMLEDDETVSRIIRLIQDKSIFIADGHHRYETARAYKQEILAAGSSDLEQGHEYVMMYLTAMSHPGLTILPAHRMIKGIQDFDVRRMLGALEPFFEMEQLCYSNGDVSKAAELIMERLRLCSSVGGEFGMAASGDQYVRLLKLKDINSIDSIIDPKIPSSLRGLDVTILRELILGRGLGLQTNSSEGKIEYAPLALEALSKVLKGEVQISFILNPTRVEQMRAAAELGHQLPHKSTYFYPKLSSGLVMNVFGVPVNS